MKKPPFTLKASILRTVLSVLLVIALGLAVLGYYLGYQSVAKYTKQVNEVVLKAHTSSTNIGTIGGNLEATLSDKTAILASIDTLTAPTASFQGQAITDLNGYATKSGLTIADIATGGDPAAAGATAVVAPAGTQTVTVTLAPTVSYASLLKFIMYVENSAPKMQINGLDITRSATEGGDSVAVAPLTIGVYTK